jgi:hypothetical protein
MRQGNPKHAVKHGAGMKEKRQTVRTQAEFLRWAGIGPDLVEFVTEFIERPECFYSMSSVSGTFYESITLGKANRFENGGSWMFHGSTITPLSRMQGRIRRKSSGPTVKHRASRIDGNESDVLPRADVIILD